MDIPFLKYTKIYYIFSGILVMVSIASLLVFGLKFSIDFSGGSILEIDFENRPENQIIQEKLKDLDLGEMVIQPIGMNAV
ncbi:MAG: protein translocase subunit SecF, partial [Parcubacteria group bacterium CG10_big_fil_rev_8_21_14_0_10_35_15]